MMPLTWMAIAGLAIKLGIDVARYAGLRAERRADDTVSWRPADQRSLPGEQRTSGFLVCHWHVDDRLVGRDATASPPAPQGRRALVCYWTFIENPSISQPSKCEVLPLLRSRRSPVTRDRTPEWVD